MRFHKYSSTGNDFIIFDQTAIFPKELPSTDWIRKVCQRRTSIGADGLILVKQAGENSVKMTYFNSDGNEVEMCGNGLRAVGRYCHEILKISNNKGIKIDTMNSSYEVQVPNYLNIKIRMTEIDSSNKELAKKYDANFLSVGVPHVVKQVDSLSNFPIDLALEIRQDPIFEDGTNVNFFQELDDDLLRIRTFERGVEAETLSCGTGVTATAVTYMRKKKSNRVILKTEGGQLVVSRQGENFFLEGPSELVFTGELF